MTPPRSPCTGPPIFANVPPGTPAVDPVVQALTLIDIVVGVTSSGLPNVPQPTIAYDSGSVTDASDASPISITTASTAGLKTGDMVMLTGVQGNTAANGTFTIKVTGPTTFTLDNSQGNGTYMAGGTWMLFTEDLPLYVQGSYAALAFAGAFQPTLPYTGLPADVNQQINYYVYAFAHYNEQLSGFGTFDYNDLNYAILGAIVQRLSEQLYGLTYEQYLQTYLFGPMGISPPSADPAPGTPMAGLGMTLANQAYPTEVSYFANSTEPPATSVFPDSTATAFPVNPTTPVPQPYGGHLYLQSHFGEGGYVANPLALTQFFNRLFAIGNGDTSGPLAPATVQAMINPINGTPVPGSAPSWWGLGWQVFAQPGTTNVPGNWTKNGALPGTSSLLFQGADGTTWAFVLNEDDGDAVGDLAKEVFNAALKDVIEGALTGPAEVTGADAGGGPDVKVTNYLGTVIGNFFAYEPTFPGGVRVALADVNGDGVSDVITAAGPGGGPHVEVINGTMLGQLLPSGEIAPSALLASFFAYSPAFTGGVFVAAARSSGGQVEIVTGAGANPAVLIIDGRDLGQVLADGEIAPSAVLGSFFAFEPAFTGGVRVAVGDVNDDGTLDVVAAAGPGGGPHVEVVNGSQLNQVQADGEIAPSALLASFFAFSPTFTGGVYVAVAKVGSTTDLVVGAGAGGQPAVLVVGGTQLGQVQPNGQIAPGALVAAFLAFSPVFTGGVRVGGSGDFVFAAAGPGGGPLVVDFDVTTLAIAEAFFAYDPLFGAGVYVAG